MKKRIILCALVMVLFFSLDVSAASKFKDVKETAWYYKYLSPLVDNKIIDGMPDGTFQGNKTLNADQLLKLMVTTVNPYASYERAIGFKEKNGTKTYQYTDSWFDPYLKVLQAMNIIEPIEEMEKDSTGTEYKVVNNLASTYYNKPVSREEVAYWVEKGYSFLRACNQPYDGKSDDEMKTEIFKWYSDASQIDSKYYKAIYILHESGIMEGSDDGGFWPKKVLTRAESTAVIYRLQKERYRQLSLNNLDFDTNTARVEYVLRADGEWKQKYEKVVVKSGYVYSPDGMGETARTDLTGGTAISQVTVKDIDLTDFPLVDDPDTPEWGEDEKGFSDAFKEELRKMANKE